MFERISNSWKLAKASASVLNADKELMIFPALSAVMLVLVTVAFALPIFLTENAEGMLQGAASYAVAFLFYLVSYFVIFFCNSALVGAAMIRLRGGDPTVADGFRIASSKAGTIFGYALIAATVGMVLRALQERAGFIGKIIIGLIGMAWNLATFLVVPVLVTEDVSPVDAVKRSMTLLKKTWGEQVIGGFSLGAITRPGHVPAHPGLRADDLPGRLRQLAGAHRAGHRWLRPLAAAAVAGERDAVGHLHRGAVPLRRRGRPQPGLRGQHGGGRVPPEGLRRALSS